ncbi:hypothetical protein Q5752_002323 [Cryptotrichosporon argae]
MRLPSALFAIALALVASARAAAFGHAHTHARTHTHTGARRAYVSGGLSCVFTCPDPAALVPPDSGWIVTGGDLEPDEIDGNAVCDYNVLLPANGMTFTPSCFYNPTTGQYNSDYATFLISCPVQLTPTCGPAQATGPNQFKRALAPRRRETLAQRRIRELQWRPPKVLPKRR